MTTLEECIAQARSEGHKHLKIEIEALEALMEEVKALIAERDRALRAAWLAETMEVLAAEEQEDDAATIAEYEAADAWHPIETAPKDGTPVLVFGGLCLPELGDGYPNNVGAKALWQFGSWSVCDTAGYGTDVDGPTHWRPLPLPPVNEAPQ